MYAWRQTDATQKTTRVVSPSRIRNPTSTTQVPVSRRNTGRISQLRTDVMLYVATCLRVIFTITTSRFDNANGRAVNNALRRNGIPGKKRSGNYTLPTRLPIPSVRESSSSLHATIAHSRVCHTYTRVFSTALMLRVGIVSVSYTHLTLPTKRIV